MRPANDRFMEEFNTLKAQVANLNNASQQQFINWLEYDPSEFTSNTSPNFIGVDSSELLSQFRTGLRLRLKESGDSNYRYFYIIDNDPTNNKVYVAGGDNYSLGGTSITELALADSGIGSLEGWPAVTNLYYDVALTEIDTSSSRTLSNLQESRIFFSLDGSLMDIFLNFEFDITDNTQLIYIRLPEDLLPKDSIGDIAPNDMTKFGRTNGLLFSGAGSQIVGGSDGAPVSVAYIGTRTGETGGWLEIYTVPTDVFFGDCGGGTETVSFELSAQANINS